MTYLDNGATTLRKPPQVVQAVAQAMGRYASPGRGGYPAAMGAAEAVYRCRELAGRLFEAEPEQVAFTLNATHALNIAIKSLVGPGDAVVVSGFEHNAVMRPLHALGAQVTAAGRRLFDPADTLRDFERAVIPGTKAVVCTHVSNVFGYRLPIEEIAALCARRGVPLIVDAAQSAGALPVSLRNLGAAFIAMPGHKGLYGPQGTGILLCGRAPKPLIEGGTGSQSRLFSMPEDPPDAAEAGTHNVPGICGLAAGIAYVLRRTPAAILRREQALLRQLTERLSRLDGLRLYCGPGQTGVLSVTAAGADCETAAAQLARRGVAVRAGLHCAPLAHESAGTLESGTIRLSFSDFNSSEDVRRAAWALAALQ
ncbi:MAG: aminotransferase class V-fold PLP-dependent enzyme [Oscillospiraceae bacterium]|nr:aminotransferase class V-fold PLP-dependent enzyme [Oscillospiraceae bacterium]